MSVDDEEACREADHQSHQPKLQLEALSLFIGFFFYATKAGVLARRRNRWQQKQKRVSKGRVFSLQGKDIERTMEKTNVSQIQSIMKDQSPQRNFFLLCCNNFFPSGVPARHARREKKSRGKKASGRSGPRERAGSGLFWGEGWEDLRPHSRNRQRKHTLSQIKGPGK